LVIIKQTRHEADHCKRGALVRVKQTRHEVDHYKRGVLVIINRRSTKQFTVKGSVGNYKADET
jgi:hypothetical protein